MTEVLPLKRKRTQLLTVMLMSLKESPIEQRICHFQLIHKERTVLWSESIRAAVSSPQPRHTLTQNRANNFARHHTITSQQNRGAHRHRSIAALFLLIYKKGAAIKRVPWPLRRLSCVVVRAFAFNRVHFHAFFGEKGHLLRRLIISREGAKNRESVIQSEETAKV